MCPCFITSAVTDRLTLHEFPLYKELLRICAVLRSVGRRRELNRWPTFHLFCELSRGQASLWSAAISQHDSGELDLQCGYFARLVWE